MKLYGLLESAAWQVRTYWPKCIQQLIAAFGVKVSPVIFDINSLFLRFWPKALFLVILVPSSQQQKTAAQPSWSEQPFVIQGFLHLSGGRRQRFILGTDNTGLVVDKVGGELGLGRGGEDGLAVALEDLQPVVDVLRMAHGLERDAGLCAQEGGADLGHQFLEGVAEVTEAAAEHPVQPGRVPGPVADLVKAGGVVEVTVLERGPVRQEHQVRRGQANRPCCRHAKLAPNNQDQSTELHPYFRYLAKNEVSFSQGIMLTRSYRSTCPAAGTI